MDTMTALYREELSSLEQAADLLRQRDIHINTLYAERNRCVSLIARLALSLGFSAGIGIDRDAEEEAWRYICFIDLPAGQISWHIHSSELVYFDDIPAYSGSWDGHSTDEKYQRVMHPGIFLAQSTDALLSFVPFCVHIPAALSLPDRKVIFHEE